MEEPVWVGMALRGLGWQGGGQMSLGMGRLCEGWVTRVTHLRSQSRGEELWGGGTGEEEWLAAVIHGFDQQFDVKDKRNCEQHTGRPAQVPGQPSPSRAPRPPVRGFTFFPPDTFQPWNNAPNRGFCFLQRNLGRWIIGCTTAFHNQISLTARGPKNLH